jgi:uncharacterized protein (DUF2141 family)
LNISTASIAALMTAITTQAEAATLTAEIGNVRNMRGHVHIDVCTQDRFLKTNCLYGGDAPARPGITTVVVHDVPPGRYAVQAYHDENDNHDVDRGLFGIPREGIGFSNDARIAFGPPKWMDAVFGLQGDVRIHLKLRYFMGASGPPPTH